MCGGIKTLTFGPRCDSLTTDVKSSHTHMNKTRQVKRTQMVATGRFTIRAFVTFSDC